MKALLSLIALAFFTTAAVAHVAVDEMADAATKFLGSLKSAHATQASLKLTVAEHPYLQFIPRARNGLPIKARTEDQRKPAMELPRSGLSDHGYSKATNSMSLETILRDLEGPNSRMTRDP